MQQINIDIKKGHWKFLYYFMISFIVMEICAKNLKTTLFPQYSTLLWFKKEKIILSSIHTDNFYMVIKKIGGGGFSSKILWLF